MRNLTLTPRHRLAYRFQFLSNSIVISKLAIIAFAVIKRSNPKFVFINYSKSAEICSDIDFSLELEVRSAILIFEFGIILP